MTRVLRCFLPMIAMFLLAGASAAQPAAYLQDHEGHMTRYAEYVQDGDWHEAITRAMAEASEGGVVFFPRGEYRVDQPIEITRSVSLIFEGGARLWTPATDLIRIISGEQIVLEGLGGRAELVNRAGHEAEFTEARGFPTGGITSVVSLNHVAMDARPNLRIKGLRLEGFRCIEGFVVEQKGPMGRVEVLDCHLVGEDMHMSHRHSEVGELRVEDSLFTGDARMGIFFTSPMPGGAVVRNNILKNVGVRAIQLAGQPSQIADGAVESLPSAIVHDNQILGGGHRAKTTTSYIMGILVYGHNISIQNNIVRDFNRGEPVPDEPYGQHILMPDGSYYRGIWVEDETRDDERGRRLAGAAIYAKARQGIISGNICTNSGWRSVIEVKTGGKEPWVLITGNVIDGSSLCIEGSYGFETGSNQSVWSNNLIYNMPETAFVVRSGRQNSYINNVIIDSKAGFRIAGRAATQELLMNNRFVNVTHPVVSMSADPVGAQVTPPTTLVVPSYAQLPEPSEAQRGRLAVVLTDEGDQVVVCRYVDNAYRWTLLGAGASSEGSASEGSAFGGAASAVVGPVSWNAESFEPVGPNLTVNPDHSQDGPSAGDPDAARWEGKGYSGFPFGWVASATGVEVGDVMQYDTEMFEHGSRSLRIGDGDEAFSWQIYQHVPVTAGKTYRAEAWLRTAGDKTRASLIVDVGPEKFSQALQGDSDSEWEKVTVMFEVPQDAPGRVRLRVWGGSAGKGNQVWVDRVTLHEVQAHGEPG